MTWDMLSIIGRHAANIGVVLSFLYVVGQPAADEFVKRAVKERIDKLEQQVERVQKSMHEQRQSQAVMSNDIENLSKNQDETRANTRMILQSLQGMRRELRQE